LSLFDDLAPEDLATVAFLKAYFDESDRSKSGGVPIFAVSGLVFKKNKAEGFVREWREMLGGIACFHMTDLVARREEFKNFSQADSAEMLKRAVSIINRYRLLAVSCSCSVEDFDDLRRAKKFHGFSSPYAICAHTCMTLIGNFLRYKKDPAKVAYFFEAGHLNSPDAEKLFSRARETSEIESAFRYRGHSFVAKPDAVPLQGADLLAWEYAKFQDETEHQFKRAARASYAALRDSDGNSFIAVHRDKDDLQSLMDRLLYAWHLPDQESGSGQ
jgi:hypothetical protein